MIFCATCVGHFLVAEEVHRVVAAAAGHRGERLRVGEDLGHRHLGLDRRHAACGLHPLQPAAPRVEVAVHRADRVVGHRHLELHDRLEQHGIGLLVRLFERHRPGDLEGHLRGVDVVLHAVDEQDADALHGRAGELAVLHRLAHALVDRGPVALRDDAADDLVDELVAELAVLRRQRLEHDRAVAELAAAAGLLLVAMPRARLLADRLLVRHARRVELDVDVEARAEAVDRDLDLHLRQAREELLARLRVAAHAAGSDPPRGGGGGRSPSSPRRPSPSA